MEEYGFGPKSRLRDSKPFCDSIIKGTTVLVYSEEDPGNEEIGVHSSEDSSESWELQVSDLLSL